MTTKPPLALQKTRNALITIIALMISASTETTQTLSPKSWASDGESIIQQVRNYPRLRHLNIPKRWIFGDLSRYNLAMHQFLRTKICMPPARPRQVERARLIKLMNQGMLRTLTLIVAPAGFGKTTLLTAWALTEAMPVAWLSLDASDQNPDRFITYIIQALQQISGKIGQTALALLHSGQDFIKAGVLYSLVNDLTEVPTDFTLFLDDYHTAENPQICDILQFLLENRPKNFHVAIATRNAPSISLTRLRALDQVTEIMADDLRFTEIEILAFLEDCMGITLPAAEFEHLKQSTEGWAVGLQMAALALTRQADDWQIPVGQEHVFDFLAQEVLRRESVRVRDFLLRVSLFDRFCARLGEALLDVEPRIDQNAAELLAYIERANLFLFPLDSTGTWYRLHALFADYLRQELERQSPEQIGRLYHQASCWFEEQGILDEAVHYAIHARDFMRAGDLLVAHYRAIIQGSQQITLLEWFSEIPIPEMDKRPILWLIKGWASVVSMDTAQAKFCADRFENVLPSRELSAKISGELKALRIMTGIFEGKNSTADEISEAFILFSEEDDFLHLLLHLNLGMMGLLAGETQQTIASFSEVLALTDVFDNPLIITITSSHKAEVHTMRGEFDLAENTFQQTFRYIEEDLGEKSFLLALPHIGFAELLREQNHFEAAQQHAERGLAYSNLWQPTASIDGKIVLARLHAALGNWDQAYSLLKSAIQAAKTSETIMDDLMAATHLVRLKLLQGDLAQAVYWAKFFNIESRSAQMPHYIQALVQLTLFRIQVISTVNDPLLAGQIADTLLAQIENAQQRGNKTAAIEALILRTYALDQAGLAAEAQTTLGQALAFGAESGYVRIFADEGPKLSQIFLKYRSLSSDSGAYLEMLLSIMDTSQTIESEPVPRLKGLIPLTRREMDVLQQMAAGRSNQEIADELVLTLNTVKKHVANILRKLEVANRTQAVMLAREKGWLV